MTNKVECIHMLRKKNMMKNMMFTPMMNFMFVMTGRSISPMIVM